MRLDFVWDGIAGVLLGPVTGGEGYILTILGAGAGTGEKAGLC